LPHFGHHNIAALPRTGAAGLPLSCRLAFETNNQSRTLMSSKFALRALTLAGFLAASALPALAAEMTPATPAPGAAIEGNASVSTGAKMDQAGQKATDTTKKHVRATKDSAKKHAQSAKLPPVSGEAGAAAGASVQH
jgi:hypothetical protein